MHKKITILLFWGLLSAFLFFGGKVSALPSQDVEAYFDSANFYFDSVNYVHKLSGGLSSVIDSYFQSANVYFDSINVIHYGDPAMPEEMKIEMKLHYLKLALRDQKHGMMLSFEEIEAKLDTLLGWTYKGLPGQVGEFFYLADAYFDSVNWVHDTWPPPEINKIEWKLHYLKYALMYEKEAKWIMFSELESKLDSLLKLPTSSLPRDVDSLFNCANQNFHEVNNIHQMQMPETTKIELKIFYLTEGLRCQKEAMWRMFSELEQKIDIYSGRPFKGLPWVIDSFFISADQWFDSVKVIHQNPRFPALMNIEWKLYFLKNALKDVKEGKWLSFQELERKLDSLISTGVEEIQGDATLPDKFTLLQNYPNPFNPFTKIEFLLEKPSWVTVDIYNILGKKVKRILEQRLKAGNYAIDWDGKDEKGNEVSSGIYFYRVQAGSIAQTRKMVLLR